MPPDSEFLMVGKTLTTLKRNCLNLLADLVSPENFKFSTSQKSAFLFGRRVWLEGANDERSENKIRGMSLSGAYCDELTLFPQSFYEMLLSRLRKPGARFFATTNPDSPNHWVKKDILDNTGLSGLLSEWHFTIDDNGFLPSEYVADLKRLYTGVFYDRFILGLWRLAEGLIYHMFNSGNISQDNSLPVGEYYVSLDYGTQNPFAAHLWRIKKGVASCKREYYYSGRDTNAPKTDEEYYRELEKLTENVKVKAVVVDHSAASFIETIRRHGKFSVMKAKNDVLDGIRFTSSLLHSGKLLFCPSCRKTIEEFGLYSWDEKSGEDKPLKENDHAMDSVRYFSYTVMRNKIRRANFDALIT
jgi:PBSX family phage terminase large subunit